ncbi:MAG: HNH endonuclease [Deltaproteobacteria bacterium]|nr:HNH endonuclease [Deltaproteobacteria bacterium]
MTTRMPQATVLERVRARLSTVQPSAEGCLDWPGAKTRKGYGTVGWTDASGAKHQVYVHRLIVEVHHGAVPSDVDVRHACDRPSCCAIEHLSVGSRHENMRDAVVRGRTQRGARHHGAKLDEAQVREIVRRVRTGEKRADLAREFSVASSQITAILSGRTWAHVTGILRRDL